MHRLRTALWTGSTTEVEITMALALGLRAVWMLWPTWQSVPVDVQGYFIPPWATETGYGYALLFCASMQATVAARRGPLARAAAAGSVMLFQGSLASAYFRAGEFYRAVVPLILATVLVEWWIAWRAWSDLRTGAAYGERRDIWHDRHE